MSEGAARDRIPYVVFFLSGLASLADEVVWFKYLTLTFGATLTQGWESAGLQLIYAIVYASLLGFRHHNAFSVDGLLQSNASKAEPL